MSRSILFGCLALALTLDHFSATPTVANEATLQRTGTAIARPSAVEGTGYGQITFINSTNVTLDFYINGEYAGRSLPGLTYTTQARAGAVNLVAHDAVNDRSVSTSGVLEEGASASWEITSND